MLVTSLRWNQARPRPPTVIGAVGELPRCRGRNGEIRWARSDRVGVRELRQLASRYLARVRLGETLEVTDRGQPIARLVPVPDDQWAALVAAGNVRPPTDSGPLHQLEPMRLASTTWLTETVAAMRDEDGR